jgi:hypothetical protein
MKKRIGVVPRLTASVAAGLIIAGLTVSCSAPNNIGTATTPDNSPPSVVTSATATGATSTQAPLSRLIPASTETSVPAVPTSAPATSQPSASVPTPGDPSSDIVAVVQQQLPEARISVACVQGDFAEAIALPPPDIASHGTALYLRRIDGAWTIAASGLGIFQEDLNSIGFPANFCNVPPRGATQPPANPVLASTLQVQLRNGDGKTAWLYFYAPD